MRVIEVERTSRRDIRDFLRLPFEIYKNTPQWVPPLMPAERRRFHPDYPFYSHSEAAFLLARDDAGRTVGRLAVMNHRPHNDYRGAKDALLYLYEAVDDDRVPRLLFDAAAEWAASRGLNRLVGPKGFLTVGEGLGLLVEGFEHRPAFGIAYNHSYYVRHWEEIGGMVKEVDYLSAVARRENYQYPAEIHELAEKVKVRRGFSVPDFKSKKEILRHAPAIQRAYNAAFADLWSYTPIPDSDMSALVDRLLTIAEPSMLKLIFKGEQVIGFIFVYPDISEGLQRARGELWPLGWLTLLLERRRTKWLNLNGNAILPEYQGLGANFVMYDELAKIVLGNMQYHHADFVQVQESNAKMLADLGRMIPLNIYKRHRVYTKVLSNE